MAKVSFTGGAALLAIVVLGLAANVAIIADGSHLFSKVTFGGTFDRHLLVHGRSLTALVCIFPTGADALLPCPGDSKGACCDTNKQGGNCDYCVRDDGCNTCSYALPVPACCAPDTSG